MYSSRLYKYRDSYVLFIPTVHAFGSLKLTHTLLVQTHTHDVPPPLVQRSLLKARIWDIFKVCFIVYNWSTRPTIRPLFSEIFKNPIGYEIQNLQNKTKFINFMFYVKRNSFL